MERAEHPPQASLRLAWAGAAALALHAGALGAVRPREARTPVAPQPLVVEMVAQALPPAAAPAAPAAPAAHASERPRPMAKPRAPRLLVAAAVPGNAAPQDFEVQEAPRVAPAEGPPADAQEEGPRAGAMAQPEAAGAQEVAERGWGAYHEALLSRVHRARRYPAQARRLGLSGTATVEFCVGRDGRLTCPPTVTRSVHPLLDSAATRLVESSAPFAPFPGHRHEGEMRFAVDVRFELDAP